jgi:hypothetical protein
MGKAFLVAILIVYTAQAQVSYSGTFVIIDTMKDKVVIAADSRVGVPGIDVPPNDDYCKISTFHDKIVFTAAGISEFFGSNFPFNPLWSNISVLKESIHAVGANVNINAVAEEWERRMVLNWWLAYTKNPHGVRAIAAQGIFVMAFWATIDDTESTPVERLSMIEWDEGMPIPIVVTHSARIPVYCSDCGFVGHQFCGLGDIQVMAQTCLSKTLYWQAWRASFSVRHIPEWNIASDFVAFTEEYSPGHVGGAIDLLELDRSGIHWLAKKENCPESQD